MLLKQVQWKKSDFLTHLSSSGTQGNENGLRVYVPNSVSWDTLGNVDEPGIPWQDGLVIEEDFKVTNAISAQTAVKWGFRKDHAGIQDDGYDLYLNGGKIGGTSWPASGVYQDRTILLNEAYTIRYEFVGNGDVKTYVNGGMLGPNFLGVRLLEAGITGGFIYWHSNVAGVAPNDGTGKLFTSLTRWGIDNFSETPALEFTPGAF